MARLLGDIPGDLLAKAIDECQLKSRFLPTVAEVRELAEPELGRRQRTLGRLLALQRLIESGPVAQLGPPPRPLLDRRGEPMNEADTAELNAILEGLGAKARYRPDGSRYMVGAASNG